MIYLDYAANTPVDEEVLNEFVLATKKYVANPNRQGMVKKGQYPYTFVKKHWFNAGWWGFMPKTTTSKSTTTKKTTAVTKTNKPLNSSGDIDINELKKMNAGKCPVAPTITGVLNGSTYYTNKVNYSVNTSNLTTDEVNKLYVVTESYNKFKKTKITRLVGNKGKSETKTETLGEYNEPVVKKLTNVLSKNNDKYSKIFTTGDTYRISLYSGKKLCYLRFVVKDGVTLKNTYRRYNLSRYSILTTKGVVSGTMTNAKASSTDEKVFKVSKKMNELSLKASTMTAKDGHEKNKSATITIEAGNLKGSFKVVIPDRYAITSYLSNPLTGDNTPIGKDSLSKADNTKDSSGNKAYGVEFTRNPKTNKKLNLDDKVYAMDSGTVTAVRKSNSKDTYGNVIRITSTINKDENEKFIHSYAHLNKMYVKKGMRVHKGQVIGTIGKSSKKDKKLKNPTLFVTLDHINKNNKSEVLLLNNFVGRDLRYNVVTNKDDNYKLFTSYIKDSELCKYRYNVSCK